MSTHLKKNQMNFSDLRGTNQHDDHSSSALPHFFLSPAAFPNITCTWWSARHYSVYLESIFCLASFSTDSPALKTAAQSSCMWKLSPRLLQALIKLYYYLQCAVRIMMFGNPVSLTHNIQHSDLRYHIRLDLFQSLRRLWWHLPKLTQFFGVTTCLCVTQSSTTSSVVRDTQGLNSNWIHDIGSTLEIGSPTGSACRKTPSRPPLHHISHEAFLTTRHLSEIRRIHKRKWDGAHPGHLLTARQAHLVSVAFLRGTLPSLAGCLHSLQHLIYTSCSSPIKHTEATSWHSHWSPISLLACTQRQ